MRETRFQPGLLLRRFAALGLVVWLAGLGCLLGCEGPAAVAAAVPAAESHAEAAQSCAAMSSGHGCCHAAKARKARAGATSAGSPSQHDDSAAHCPLGRQTSDPARKVRANDDAPAVADAPPPSHDFRPPSFSQPNSAAPRAQDRGGTYLRCCVFLI